MLRAIHAILLCVPSADPICHKQTSYCCVLCLALIVRLGGAHSAHLDDHQHGVLYVLFEGLEPLGTNSAVHNPVVAAEGHVHDLDLMEPTLASNHLTVSKRISTHTAQQTQRESVS